MFNPQPKPQPPEVGCGAQNILPQEFRERRGWPSINRREKRDNAHDE